MNTLFTRVLPVLILLVIFYLVPAVGIQPREDNQRLIPRPVRVASWLEAVFGIMLFFSGVLFAVDPTIIGLSGPVGAMYALLCCLGAGVAWLVLAANINSGSKKARRICFVLSILRVFTIVGVAFSIAGVLLLYAASSSREYYAGQTACR